ADQVEWVCDNLQMREHITISVHTHNDRGCGVAAAELAVMAGADRVEGTLMGNGERTGNMDLVTMAMNLYSQGIDPMLDFSGMAEIVEVVEACTEIQTHPRHPYAGELVFTAFSGSHQDAIRKCLSRYQDGGAWNVAYLPIDPRDLGRRYEEVVRINSQSGKGGVAYVLERELGIHLPRWLQIELGRIVQRHAEEEGGEVDAGTLRALFQRHLQATPAGWTLVGYDVHQEAGQVRADVQLGDAAQRQTLRGTGQGVVEAVVSAVQTAFDVQIRVEAYDEFALTSGTDARAMACLRVTVDGEPSAAVHMAADTTTATLQALLSAIGRRIAVTADAVCA
ncbi:MAG: 2-isopropylmalate synthase, partial [Gammaproteobacteria bacterium]|nr:2-isopropylmalate synthase [Gammaproteobacteria bacterium]